MQIIEDIIQCIFNSSTICILSHDSPDADAIGSSLALEDALRQLGKDAKYCLQTNVNDAYRPVIGDRQKSSFKNIFYDLVFVLDCSYFNRMQVDCERLSSFVISIDHHKSFSHEGDLVWRETVPATSALIYRLLKQLETISEFRFNSYIATNLLFALREDTDNFKIINDFDSFSMASDLVKLGADIKFINSIEKYNIALIKLMSKVLNKLVYNEKTKIAYIIVTKEDIDSCGSNFNDASRLIDMLKRVRDISVIYLIIKNKNRLSIKARSDEIDVRAVMSEFGGGGHPFASGTSNYHCADIYQFIDSLIKKTQLQMS